MLRISVTHLLHCA